MYPSLSFKFKKTLGRALFSFAFPFSAPPAGPFLCPFPRPRLLPLCQSLPGAWLILPPKGGKRGGDKIFL